MNNMSYYENNGLDEESVTPDPGLPGETTEGVSLELSHVAESAIALSASNESMEVPTLAPDVMTDPSAAVMPRAHLEKTSREDYGEGIFPPSTQFLIDVPKIGHTRIKFEKEGINVEGSKVLLGVHKLYLLTLLLKNIQTPFTSLEIANGGYNPKQPSERSRLDRLSREISELKRIMASALTGTRFSDGPIFREYTDDHQVTFTWIYPAVLFDTVEHDDTSAVSEVVDEPIG